MTYLFENYKRAPIEFVKAEGSYLIDSEGKAYLDFSSGIGVTNLGFHPQVQQALIQQAGRIWHSPNLYLSSLQEQVAQELAGSYDYLAFFCNSGAEANEAAIKLARKATGKQCITTFQQSFHGRTFGAMAATGQDKIKKGFGDGVPHFSYAVYNDLSSVEDLVNQDTAAVMLELIQGESGVHPAEADFVKKLADFCQREGILLIVDEVQTGMGRTGQLYSFEHFGIIPDIVTLAKGLANGLPAGALLGKSSLAPAFGPGSHGSTFGGNKLAMAAALEILHIMKEARFLEEVRSKSAILLEQLQLAFQDHPKISAVRGLGMMIGIETSASLSKIVEAARQKGLIILTAGENVIRLLPPLTISREEIQQGIAILKEVFSQVDK
ncbi:acetylornithine transaminase [Streptococcus gordonii]|uniref:Acetylornithine aminotransferase n=1 Tax=Streptococcus gordonii (strain Challis / ATCC 35105 / BCRC 15272 / CH1 / DL1 / V288) TaxID=467705 RepID=A8AYI4_STRGC|nr:acetylornithine transaminase [Streptococcus gordonii]ABV11004.1 Acetylornithine aminotransferase (ACOAT) [Streptococcus gordonii str. Challis substr. CH1]MBZ2138024.1 acetylornithine transaminase [Streptococcus gordonii]MCC3175807.1 transaminase, acetylornithine/succinylornithine family protein [Streptococcus gordonii]MCY7139451.1 acetylornithine transaminase [Streptococcus gordonii]QGS43889.1 acetylornithine transaminase [Streptococcus gordonii]